MYARSDTYPNDAAPVDPAQQYPLEADAVGPCWSTAFEHHATYDLLFVEFDDEGWENPYGQATSKISAAMRRLQALAQAGPLSIIVFTHGWHHTASAADNNVKQFRFLLYQAASDHKKLFEQRSAATRLTSQSLAQVPRVVGIYVGWRGDSVTGPGLEYTSIWDRKLSAENVSLGAVHTLFAHLHNFFVAHQCHRASAPGETSPEVTAAASARGCWDVRMLVIGHSFGGLITYRSLSSRLIANVVETFDEDPTQASHEAYSFGDLVVLINPAFEAVRFEPLAEAAASRSYPVPRPGRSAQLPILIVAQSAGDSATETFFPLFRRLTTPLDNARGPEIRANVETVGWDERYITHDLSCKAPKPGTCDAVLDQRELEAWWRAERTRGYSDFQDGPTLLNGITAERRTDPGDFPRAAFDPVWVMHTDPVLIKDHSDVLNPRFIEFVRELYYVIQREEDCHLSGNEGCPVPAP